MRTSWITFLLLLSALLVASSTQATEQWTNADWNTETVESAGPPIDANTTWLGGIADTNARWQHGATQVDTNSVATCFYSQRNSTSGSHKDAVFTVVNRSGSDINRTIYTEFLDDVVWENTARCDVSYAGSGEFGVLTKGGSGMDGASHLNLSVTTDWGSTWNHFTVDSETVGDGNDELWLGATVISDGADTYRVWAAHENASGDNTFVSYETTNGGTNWDQNFLASGWSDSVHPVKGGYDEGVYMGFWAGFSSECSIRQLNRTGSTFWGSPQFSGPGAANEENTCVPKPVGSATTMLVATNDNVGGVHIHKTTDTGGTWSEINTLSHNGIYGLEMPTWTDIEEGLFLAVSNSQSSSEGAVYESDDQYSTSVVDDDVTSTANTTLNRGFMFWLTELQFGNNLPVFFFTQDDDARTFGSNAIIAAAPTGGSDPLPFEEIFPTTTVESDFELASGVEVDYNLGDPNVWVRDPHQAGTPSKVYRYDADLNEETVQNYCASSGANTVRVNDALTVTLDNLPISVCLNSVSTDSIVVLMDQGGVITKEYTDKTDQTPNVLTSRTGNEVLWVNSADTETEQADIPRLESVLRQKLTFDVDVSINDDNAWVVHTGSAGTWVMDAYNGTIKASSTSRTWESVQINGSTLWSLDNEANELAKWSITGGSFSKLDSETVEVDITSALTLSPDSRFLTVIESNDRVGFYHAGNLSEILKTKDMDTPRDADIDACNNYIFVVNDTALSRFDVHDNTDCTALGGTDSTGAGGENENNGQEPFGDTTDEQTDTTPGAGGTGVDSTSMLSQATLTSISNSLGVGVSGVRIMLAGFLISGLTLAAAGIASRRGTSTRGAAIGGTVGGFVISYGLELIPSWFLFLMGLVLLALIVQRDGD